MILQGGTRGGVPPSGLGFCKRGSFGILGPEGSTKSFQASFDFPSQVLHGSCGYSIRGLVQGGEDTCRSRRPFVRGPHSPLVSTSMDPGGTMRAFSIVHHWLSAPQTTLFLQERQLWCSGDHGSQIFSFVSLMFFHLFF